MKLDKKNFLLIGAIVVVMFVSWQFTVKKTFEYKEQLNSISLDQLIEKQKKLKKLASQNRFLQKALQDKNITGSTIREVLFTNALESESLKIIDYNDNITIEKENATQQFYQITVTGNYKELIHLINVILTKCPNASLEHLEFLYRKKNYRSKEKLEVEVVFSVLN